ncbi:MAG: hypothetical protein HYY06_27645 [Deltaproteobacteria bacterium]|nr:hypothetical protein [Deltaproteobacteria bacterium]
MSIKRITISVPDRVATKIKKAAGDEPVSTWVTTVIEERLEDAELERRCEEFCGDVRPTRADSRRAAALFRRLTRRSGGRRSA